MAGFIFGKIVSVLISGMLLAVPQQAYQKKISEIPLLRNVNDGYDLKGWSYQSTTSPTTGIEHFYYAYPCVQPDAPVIVMLHGFNTNGRAFLNLSPLSSRYRLISYNFPDESKFYQGGIQDFVPMLDDFLSVMKIDSVILMGNSVGGAIALHYAASQGVVPVSSLILVSTSVFGSTEKDRRKSIGMAKKLLKYPDYKLFYLVEKTKSMLAAIEGGGLVGENTTELLQLKKPSWYRQILASLAEYKGTSDAAAIRCPVIAIHGGADRVVSLDAGRTISNQIPQTQFTVLAGKGHAMIYKDGRELSGIIAEGLAMPVEQHASLNSPPVP